MAQQTKQMVVEKKESWSAASKKKKGNLPVRAIIKKL